VFERLARALVETDPVATAAFRFSIVPVADPDGVTLDASRPGKPIELEVFCTRA
jgi:hypothetical protein